MTRRSLLMGLPAFAPATALFEEIAPAVSGIRWTHQNAISPQRYLPESLGPGVAFLDYDNDGWLDLFLVNSGPSDFFTPRQPLQHALYRNQRNGAFRNVTASAGIAPAASFGMGAAVGDYNNDGFPDLFVTAYGSPTLYRNNGDGTFRDVTRQAGLDIPGWTTSALWFDYDGDGLLDLFVCSFVEYRKETQAACIAAKGGKPGYCIPRMFRPTSSFLFRNNGDGTFRDVSRETRIAARLGKALGAVATDIDNNGLADLFVANDTVENFLFANRGPKGFDDIAMAALVALSTDGFPRSGMGVDAADINNDGRQDLFVANIDRERHSLYRNTGYGMFDDLSFANEIGRATYYLSGWGLKFFDFDNDGITDLLIANGHPDDMVADRTPLVKYREPLLLFEQRNGEFRNISNSAGPAFQRDYAARGLAIGDYNNDGFPDALIGINGAAPLLLRNSAASKNNWLGIKLRGTRSNRDAIGARITWHAGGVTRSRYKTAGGSYLSAHDPREILGLGQAPRASWVDVKWPLPSTRTERFSPPAATYTTLVEGEGDPRPA
ncbi:MAG: CRTAC1 family protein [Acidobacteria bacterium]|nr:CRTAC1 family protein [Acidobacteriota bacterium]